MDKVDGNISDSSTVIIDDHIGEDSIDLSNIMASTFNYSTAAYPYGNVTITNGTGNSPLLNSGQYTINTGGTLTTPYTFTTPGNPGLHVNGDSEFDGDVKIKGKSILKMLETIEKRLSILQPDPEKLEHFEALRKAYEHYKTLESLCEVPKKEEK